MSERSVGQDNEDWGLEIPPLVWADRLQDGSYAVVGDTSSLHSLHSGEAAGFSPSGSS
jgi:hypothetical protein